MSHQNDDFKPLPAHAAEPLVCRRCGAVTTPRITPGASPHAFRANCPDCGGFMQWLSKHTPEERARRQAQAQRAVMAQQAPTAKQLHYLQILGDHDAAPANKQEAADRIDELLRRRGA